MRRHMLKLAAVAVVVVGLLLPGVAGTAAASPAEKSQGQTPSQITIKLNPAAPNSFTVSGSLLNVPSNVNSAVVTLTLNSGQIATQIVGPANGWTFNFNNIPNDGWKNIAVTDVSASSPQYVSAGGSVPAYVYPNPFLNPTYAVYNWNTGYPAYTYTWTPRYYTYVPAYQLGYAYSSTFCTGCGTGWNYPSNGFVPVGSGYYYRNGQWYYYPYTPTAVTYYTTDYLNSYRTVATPYNTYYYTPVVYNSGYYYNPVVSYYYGSGSGVNGLLR